jgi:serpin B
MLKRIQQKLSKQLKQIQEQISPMSPSLLSSNNQFGFDLLHTLHEQTPAGVNLFLSPTSLLLALAMTGNGADAHTWPKLQTALRLGEMSQSEVNQAVQSWLTSLSEPNPAVSLTLANALWLEQNYPLNPAVAEQLTAAFQAQLTNLNFGQAEQAAAQINQWTAEHTKNLIKELVTPADLAAAVLVLTNAIHFKGAWQKPFEKARTQDKPFYLTSGEKITRPFMSRAGKYLYHQDEEVELINLPFGPGRYSLVIALPRQSLAELAPQLNASQWHTWQNKLWGQWPVREQFIESYLDEALSGTISLPRFQLETQVELKKLLDQMGLEGAVFTQFSTTPDPLIISAVIHKAFLEVNEEGAEAAAATAVMMARGAFKPPVPPFSMLVDRPFFCTIQDNTTGLILFAGLVYEPAEIQ